ncbi:MAG: hypothetical protein H6736_04425 [Alphaproteobacteria bacterium]|nr:hypothetical protein [Alphaproteobacteria bacterium]
MLTLLLACQSTTIVPGGGTPWFHLPDDLEHRVYLVTRDSGDDDSGSKVLLLRPVGADVYREKWLLEPSYEMIIGVDLLAYQYTRVDSAGALESDHRFTMYPDDDGVTWVEGHDGEVDWARRFDRLGNLVADQYDNRRTLFEYDAEGRLQGGSYVRGTHREDLVVTWEEGNELYTTRQTVTEATGPRFLLDQRYTFDEQGKAVAYEEGQPDEMRVRWARSVDEASHTITRWFGSIERNPTFTYFIDHYDDTWTLDWTERRNYDGTTDGFVYDTNGVLLEEWHGDPSNWIERTTLDETGVRTRWDGPNGHYRTYHQERDELGRVVYEETYNYEELYQRMTIEDLGFPHEVDIEEIVELQPLVTGRIWDSTPFWETELVP